MEDRFLNHGMIHFLGSEQLGVELKWIHKVNHTCFTLLYWLLYCISGGEGGNSVLGRVL